MTTAIVFTFLFYAAVHFLSLHDKPIRSLRHDPVVRWHFVLTAWSATCAIYLWRAYL